MSADWSTGIEPIYDLIYLSLWNLAPTSALPWPVSDLSFLEDFGSWFDAYTNPKPQNFEINWRSDAQHVVIVFTDEPGQSYLSAMSDLSDLSTVYHEGISQIHLQQLISNCIDLNVYTFTKLAQKDTSWQGMQAGFETLTI